MSRIFPIAIAVAVLGALYALSGGGGTPKPPHPKKCVETPTKKCPKPKQ